MVVINALVHMIVTIACIECFISKWIEPLQCHFQFPPWYEGSLVIGFLYFPMLPFDKRNNDYCNKINHFSFITVRMSNIPAVRELEIEMTPSYTTLVYKQYIEKFTCKCTSTHSCDLPLVIKPFNFNTFSPSFSIGQLGTGT